MSKVALSPVLRRLVIVSALCALTGVGPGTAAASDPAPPVPEFELDGADAVVFLTGAALLGAGELWLKARVLPVPPTGLDPAGIRWGLDRRAVRPPNVKAGRVSNWTRNAAVLYPPLFTLAAAHQTGRWDTEGRQLKVELGSLILSSGISFVVKKLVSRPRPFTYLPEEQRLAEWGYDAASPRAFESSPSGHSSAAWAGSMAGLAFLITERPDLSPGTHFANGVLAGGLATATALLRVEAVKHFPTDVAVGALLGAGTGVAVAMIQQNEATEGSRGDAWASGLMGVASGALFAFLFSPPTSPFVN